VAEVEARTWCTEAASRHTDAMHTRRTRIAVTAAAAVDVTVTLTRSILYD